MYQRNSFFVFVDSFKGSGKTYSMLGKGIEEGTLTGLTSTKDLSVNFDEEVQSAHANLSSEYVGIVPRCIADMFQWIDKQMSVNEASGSKLDYSISANYLQIYNEVSVVISPICVKLSVFFL